MIDSRKHGTRSDRSWDRNGSYKLSWSRASEVSSDCALADDIVRRLIDSRLEVDNIDFWQPSTLSNQVLLVSSRNYEDVDSLRMLTHYELTSLNLSFRASSLPDFKVYSLTFRHSSASIIMFSHLHHTQLSDLFKIINDKVFKSALDQIDVHFNPRLMACAGRYFNLTKGFLRIELSSHCTDMRPP
jgi:hypothetical protein